MYVNFYEEAGCTGNIVTVEGRQTGVCMQAYGDVNSATVTGSYIFTCAGGMPFLVIVCSVWKSLSLPSLYKVMTSFSTMP